MPSLTLFLPKDGETLEVFLKRVDPKQAEGLVLFGALERQLRLEAKDLEKALKHLSKHGSRLRLATNHRALARAARAKGIRVIDRGADLRSFLGEHAQLSDALRAFSPHVWRQQLRSRLQAMGLLSLPKVRIWILIFVSAGLFLFVALRLLPAAEITVEPREDTVTQAANIFLVQTGVTVTDISPRVRSIPLHPIRVRIDRTITFDRISKEFTGQSARTDMAIKNVSAELYRLRKDSRLANQAGMVFRIDAPVTVEPGEEVTVPAIADDLDLYDEIIGDRGNVPANVEWYFIGLYPANRADLTIRNVTAATGGQTAHRTVLKPEDLAVAETELKEELYRSANQLVDEQLEFHNAQNPTKNMTRLYYEELTKSSFTGVTLPTEFLGEQITSVPVAGTLLYEAYAYDRQAVLDLLRSELAEHVEAGRELRLDSVTLDRLNAHVISYDDDMRWIKLTIDLSGTQQYVLDPLAPAGAHFAKRIREAVAGKTPDEAERIIENFPEVHRAHISMWPPWNRRLPTITYHIRVTVTQ
ncbi:MAG TPA: hypothetical protein VI913_03655 [Candidatus Peribacteraceae bacterium]|nr:hypothetical protein [Candidatus Peribacteraceae bacterium]